MENRKFPGAIWITIVGLLRALQLSIKDSSKALDKFLKLWILGYWLVVVRFRQSIPAGICPASAEVSLGAPVDLLVVPCQLRWNTEQMIHQNATTKYSLGKLLVGVGHLQKFVRVSLTSFNSDHLDWGFLVVFFPRPGLVLGFN